MIKKIRNRVLMTYNFIGKYIWKKPIIKSIDETLDYIVENHCSVSRFGDGEFAIIQGNSNGFQNENNELGARLAKILIEPIDNHIVCLPDIFGNMDNLRDSSKLYSNGLLGKERRAWLNLLDLERVYYNAFFTRCYNMFEDKSRCPVWFKKNKKIWDKQDVLLIEGQYSRLGVGNDLFANTKSIMRVLAPSKNAYEKYNDIFSAALQYGSGKLVLIALGMTATVLAFDLAKVGFWAIDIGHIDIEYEWFLQGAKEKVPIRGKYVNEVKNGDIVTDDVDPEYWNQILKVI